MTSCISKISWRLQAPSRDFSRKLEKESFTENELLQSAVLQKLIVIGEAAARISRDLQSDHPEIEWPDIVAFRNIAVHEYFAVSWEIVWITATQDVPALKNRIQQILDTELPE